VVELDREIYWLFNTATSSQAYLEALVRLYKVAKRWLLWTEGYIGTRSYVAYLLKNGKRSRVVNLLDYASDGLSSTPSRSIRSANSQKNFLQARLAGLSIPLFPQL
jgi:hypothetical protein